MEDEPYYKDLLYILKIICPKIIIYYDNDLLVSHFDIKKIRDLIIKKIFWYIFWWEIKDYIKSYIVYLVWKIVFYK